MPWSMPCRDARSRRGAADRTRVGNRHGQVTVSHPGGNPAGGGVVCRAMTTPRRLLPILAVAMLIAGCAASVGPSPSEPSTPSPLPPSAIDLPTTAPGDGGGSSGNAGSGVIDPGLPVGPVDPNDPAGGGQAKLVRPQPGQKDPHPVAPIRLESSVDGRHALIKVSWYSGIEPCSVLDSVTVVRAGFGIAITPLEGIGDPDAICIEIAVLKATIVDLGDLEPGTWRITTPTGDAAPIELTID